MLVTKQPVLKRFWYPVLPLEQLSEQPQSFQLLGQHIAIWLDEQGQPAAVEDRCCHRTAQLSKGTVVDGNIKCPYHGWTFDATGTCVRVPQIPDSSVPATYRVKSFRCAQRYGYVWVCLGEPLAEIPLLPEADDPHFRLIPEFYEPWNCAGLRVMENEFDTAHPTFVHPKSFGSPDHPTPEVMEIVETARGIHLRAVLGVVNPPLQQQNLKMAQTGTVRTMDMDWFMPFTCKLRIAYPNGLVHIIVNTATPINDSSSQIVQFCLRNDTEAETKAIDVVAFDRQVTLEDKAILETTEWDVPLGVSHEQHMLTDKPGIMMRRKLLSLLKAHDEVEHTQAKSKEGVLI
ncbi:aromatic ring-hydroxylating dioxygenase subunit alpha [Oculatella sp. LEGE 06141]|uniref:aromatic ring-hydroxylating dioxygenase subunit alpha n=1 Tax=Oculatella sp. LEGE 06141 TaxID=1828648 RepID=UPI00187DE176|nr:aromatic ring-hydroxylating dioxygenase subunit alpha [Oculatella sp. LEGE 06141]MBE9178922.1 aromatic ring-hydroxylating dioxygenase subunit alpha [Oculatella sp. LEGE 06141]